MAPTTPEAARRRFVRATHKALARIARPRPHARLAEFETAMGEALDDLRRHLRPDRPDDITAFEAGIALLGAGHEPIRVGEDALGIRQAQTAARTGQRNEGAQSDAA